MDQPSEHDVMAEVASTIQLQTFQLINRYKREFDRLEKESIGLVVLMMTSLLIFGCPKTLMALWTIVLIVLMLPWILARIEHRTRAFENSFEEVDGEILPPLQEQGDHLMALTLGLRLALLQYRAQELEDLFEEEEFAVEDTLILSDTINLI